MIKDIAIAVLTGIAIVQGNTPPGAPQRPILVMGIAVMVFMALLWVDDLWDKRKQIMRCICSRGCWCLIQLRTWPIETVQRRRRQQRTMDYIRRLQNMQPSERSLDPRESET